MKLRIVTALSVGALGLFSVTAQAASFQDPQGSEETGVGPVRTAEEQLKILENSVDAATARANTAKINVQAAERSQAVAATVQDGSQPNASTELTKAREQLAAAEEEKAEAKQKLENAYADRRGEGEAGFFANFGLGAAVFMLNRAHIDEAVVQGGVVRVTKQRDDKVSLWLQANALFENLNILDFLSDRIIPGVFVGLGGGPNAEFLDTFGGGALIAIPTCSKSSTPKEGGEKEGAEQCRKSLNIGAGYFTSTVRRLGDGIKEGEPLPEGVEGIYFKDRSASGWMFTVSFGF